MDSFLGLMTADSDLVTTCTPGGLYARVFPQDKPGDGVNSWVRARVLLNPDPFVPVEWNMPTRCSIWVQVETQRVSKDDQPGRRCEIVHSKIQQLVVGQTPHASMVIGFARTTGPTTNEFRELDDIVVSNATYDCIIN